MDRGAWGATVPGVTKELDMTKQLNNNKQDSMAKTGMWSRRGVQFNWRSLIHIQVVIMQAIDRQVWRLGIQSTVKF